MKKYSKTQVDRMFKEDVLPSVRAEYEQDRRRDIPARCEAYNNFVDYLQKDGRLTESQANRYCIPNNLIK
jgi:tRNA A37 N6-isopentenylltransferase MiaA